MLQLEEVRALILAGNPGDEVEVNCEGRIVRPLTDEIPGLTWKQITLGHFIFIVPEPSMKSGKTALIDALDKYNGGMLPFDISENSVRVYVSQYNKMHGTKFKVTVKDAVPHVYADVSERRYISESEFQRTVEKYVAELNRLRVMVRPDSYFQMASEEYDNGIPSMTADDLNKLAGVEDDDWGIPKRGTIYVCDDCHEVIPAEHGEVDVCASCMEARESGPGDEEPSNVNVVDFPDHHSVLKVYDCEECGEELLAYENDPKVWDMCKGIE